MEFRNRRLRTDLAKLPSTEVVAIPTTIDHKEAHPGKVRTGTTSRTCKVVARTSEVEAKGNTNKETIISPISIRTNATRIRFK
jgi:hypothetical protein